MNFCYGFISVGIPRKNEEAMDRCPVLVKHSSPLYIRYSCTNKLNRNYLLTSVTSIEIDLGYFNEKV